MSASVVDFRPKIAEKDVRLILEEQYGLGGDAIKSIGALYSYDDRNFHIKLNDSQDEFVLKITNYKDSKNFEFIDESTQLMRALSDFVPTTTPSKTKNGSFHGTYTYQEGTEVRECIVRLFGYLPGRIVGDNVSADQAYQWGQVLGKMHKHVGHLKFQSILERSFLWSWQGVPQILEFVDFVKDDSDRSLVSDTVHKFLNDSFPILSTLERRILHGDLNQKNILVNDQSVVYAIIDFGDCQGGPFIWDLAVALAYIGMSIDNIEQDMIQYLGQAIAGYASIMSHVLEGEKTVETLKTLTCARYTQSLVLGLRTYATTGDEYVFASQKKGWPAFRLLNSQPLDHLRSTWNSILSEYEILTVLS